MKKLNKKQKKKMSCYSAIGIAIICIFVSAVFLFKNLNWMTISFFLFGIMFGTGYWLLTLALKRIGVKVNA